MNTGRTVLEQPAAAPTKASLRAWWNHFTKKEGEKGRSLCINGRSSHSTDDVHSIQLNSRSIPSSENPSKRVSSMLASRFRPLMPTASCMYGAAFPLSLPNGALCCFLLLAIDLTDIIASSGLFLKENGRCFPIRRHLLFYTDPLITATETEGVFRVSGSNKRMRELQAAFEAPPRVRLSDTILVLSLTFVIYPAVRTQSGMVQRILHAARCCERFPKIPHANACASCPLLLVFILY